MGGGGGVVRTLLGDIIFPLAIVARENAHNRSQKCRST